MPKPISQRGFEISKGNYDRYQVNYSINQEGLEVVSVNRGGFSSKHHSSVSIILDEGEIKYLRYSTSQFKDSDNMEGEEWKIKSKQATCLYHEVKKILNVDEELKKYCPRFSHESEITPFNILEIEEISQLESFVNEKS